MNSRACGNPEPVSGMLNTSTHTVFNDKKFIKNSVLMFKFYFRNARLI